jgi:hypothetical protein
VSGIHFPSTGHLHQFAQFQVDARNGTLPSYSFIEPSFTIEPNDQHAPHNVTVEAVRQQRELQPHEVEQLRQRVPTVAHMTQYFKEVGMTNP